MKKIVLSIVLLISSAKIVTAETNLKPKIASSVANSVVDGVVVGLLTHGMVSPYIDSRYSLPLTCVGAIGISLGTKALRGTLFSHSFAEMAKSTAKTLLAGGVTAGGGYLIGFRDPMMLAQIGAAGAFAWKNVKSLEQKVSISQEKLSNDIE